MGVETDRVQDTIRRGLFQYRIHSMVGSITAQNKLSRTVRKSEKPRLDESVAQIDESAMLQPNFGTNELAEECCENNRVQNCDKS